ncbi:glycosyltransferase [Moheibacter lacus]|uniref:Glycosyltransferase n=1 Tax=Moheibacter lacus TaxID=2745851 RepID=A0A838ZNU6_9FLAO|nr:glycosyltransferase [Moheibacter lacus]MBA5628395.1 glycosyltransferase [Moheibacter lacus]
MDNLMVSICSITYNHAPYIRECLDGFLMQKCDFEYEVLIHDDASTDGTAKIIKEYQEKYPHIIKPIFQTENQWSKGVRTIQSTYNFSRAQGKYIAMCEGDDYWTDPLKLQKQVDFLEANPNFSISFHRAMRITPDGEKINEFPSLNLKSKLSTEDLALNNFIPNLSVIFRKTEIDTKLLQNMPLGDYAMHMANSRLGFIHYHKEVMAAYRINVGVFSGKEKYIQRQRTVQTLDGIIERFGFEGKILENLISHRNNLLFYIFKDKVKLDFSVETISMLRGREIYRVLPLFKRLKFIIKSVFVK